MFADKLVEAVKNKKNPSVAGLDPRIEYIPLHLMQECFSKETDSIKAACKAILEFNKKIIDAIFDIVPAVKLQLACYEVFGETGMCVFKETCSYAKSKNLIVIADGKRNDIGSTAQEYSKAYLGYSDIKGSKYTPFNVDALTINPYLGYDGIKPFIDDCLAYGKGIFILVKTSNKSSGDIQDLELKDGMRVYEKVANLVDVWGENCVGKYGYSSVGAVVGATFPEQANIVRKLMPKAYILVPGYGMQGASAEDARKSFNSDGLGAIVNASRSIMCAYKSELWKEKYDETDFALASRAEAIRMKEDLNNALLYKQQS